MKKFLLFAVISCVLLPGFAAGAQEEIVIEMTGRPDKKTPEQNIWDKDAVKLTKLFRKKNKEEVLKTVDSIAAREKIITAKDGTSYVLIQYGEETKDYRKFLFREKAPQPFVTCAAGAKDAVAIFQRYGLNIGLRKGDFLQAFSALKFPTELISGTKSFTVYEVVPEQLPIPAKEPLFVVFEQSRLVELFNSAADFNAYQKTLPPPPPPEIKPETPAKTVQKPQNKIIYKGLLSGGTLHDRMYMPRIISGPLKPTSQPNSATPK